MNLQIKTLSPIHIGNGEKYNGLCYVEDIFSKPKKIFLVDFEKIKKLLKPNELDSFISWVITEDHPSWFKFCKFELNKPNLLNEFKKIASYAFSNYSTIQLRDIDCFIKENNKSYIPGTEIKGAIRTAILYVLLNNESSLWDKKSCLQVEANVSMLIESIREFGNKHKLNISKAGNKRLEKGMRDERRIKEKILVEQMEDIQKRLQIKLLHANNNNDAKYDLLKTLFIADTDLKNPTQCLFISDLKALNISRQFPLFQELCKKDQIFTCQGFKLDNNRTILDRLGFSDEQKHVVSDVRNLLRCCYEFSNRLLDEELSYQQYSPKIKDRLNTIRNENNPGSPVIRIGKNEGYLSLTVGLIVNDKDKSLYDNVLCHATKNTSYTGNFPKTRRIVNLENGDVDTCGWVKLMTTD